MKFIDATPGENYMIIEEMFAFISSDKKGEGIIGMLMPDGTQMPLVGANMARVESLRPLAKQIGEFTNKKIKLIKFNNRVDLEDIT